MSEGNLPKWLVENSDGSITIKFDDMARAPKIDGTEVKSLQMREPTVDDQIIAEKTTSHLGEREVTIFANLTGQSPEGIRGLTMRQYGRLQEAYTVFTS